MVPEHPSEATWSQLEKEAAKEKMSTTTLSAHLKELHKLGMIERRVDPATYPPKVYYCKTRSVESLLRPGEIGLPLWTLTKEDLAEFQSSGGNIDDLIFMGSVGILSLLSDGLPSSVRRAIIKELEVVPVKEADKSKVVRVKLSTKDKAHKILDKEIDVNLRPLAHVALDYYFGVDPRNNMPLICNMKILNHIIQLMKDQMKHLEEVRRSPIIEQFVDYIVKHGKETGPL